MTIDEAIEEFKYEIESIRLKSKNPHYSGDNWQDSFTMTIERDLLAIDALRELKRSLNMTNEKAINRILEHSILHKLN